MRMICRTSGLGTRMPLSASSLKSAIWAALPPIGPIGKDPEQVAALPPQNQ